MANHVISATLTDTEYNALRTLLSRATSRAARSLASKLTGTVDDLVTVTCYGKTEMVARSAAIAEYEMAVDCSDGCERERYFIILDGLRRGLTTVTDRD